MCAPRCMYVAVMLLDAALAAPPHGAVADPVCAVATLAGPLGAAYGYVAFIPGGGGGGGARRVVMVAAAWRDDSWR